jgi:hypothetical protein
MARCVSAVAQRNRGSGLWRVAFQPWRNVTEALAYGALRFSRGAQGAEALVWAQARAIFQWNDIPL